MVKIHSVPAGKKKFESYWPWICGFLIGCLYECSNTSALYWGDSGEFLSVASTLGIGHPYGHPLFWLMGRLSMMLFRESPAAAMNHLTALFSAATCVVVGLLARNWTPSRLSLTQRLTMVFTVTALYAVSTTIWTQASFVEVYNIQAFFLALAIYFLDQYSFRDGTTRHLLAAAYFWGISITLGLYAGAAVILAAAIWLRHRKSMRIRYKEFLPAALFLGLGLSLWAYLPVRSMAQPVYFFEKIVSLKAFIHYLSRGYYANLAVPGITAIPLIVTKMGILFFQNLGIWGCLLFVLGAMSCLNRKIPSDASPYLLSSFLLVLIFCVLIPLNMTFHQMDGMDVYTIPVFLMAVPVFTLGIGWLASLFGKGFAVILFVPVLLMTGLRWNRIAIVDENRFEDFRSYLMDVTPHHAMIFSTIDEISYPYYYSVFSDGNPKEFRLRDPRSVEQDKALFHRLLREESGLFNLHEPFLRHIDDLNQVRIAGPFLASVKDSLIADRLESEFNLRFAFQDNEIHGMRRMDRIGFAKIWASRGIFWLVLSSGIHENNDEKENAFQMGRSCLERACALDDFSFMGAAHHANLAFILSQAGIHDDVVSLARKALKINPFLGNAYRALNLLSEKNGSL